MNHSESMYDFESGGSSITAEGLQGLMLTDFNPLDFGFVPVQEGSAVAGMRGPFNKKALLARMRALHALQLAALEIHVSDGMSA